MPSKYIRVLNNHVDSTKLPKIAKVCVHALCMQTWLSCASCVSLQAHSTVGDTTNTDDRSQNCSKMSKCKLLSLSRYPPVSGVSKGFWEDLAHPPPWQFEPFAPPGTLAVQHPGSLCAL